MTGAELPTTIIGLVSLAIITIGGLVKLRLEQKTANAKLNEMHEQTVNDHQKSKTNLRDDLDTTRDTTIATHDGVSEIREITRDIQERQMAQGRELFGIRNDLTNVRVDISGVSRELHDERQRSITVDEQLWRAVLERLPKPDSPDS